METKLSEERRAYLVGLLDRSRRVPPPAPPTDIRLSTLAPPSNPVPQRRPVDERMLQDAMVLMVRSGRPMSDKELAEVLHASSPYAIHAAMKADRRQRFIACVDPRTGERAWRPRTTTDRLKAAAAYRNRTGHARPPHMPPNHFFGESDEPRGA